MTDSATHREGGGIASAAEAVVETRTLRQLGRLWRDWLRPYRAQLIWNLVLIGVVAGTTGLYPQIIKWSVDGFEKRETSMIATASLTILLVVAVKALSLWGHKVLTNVVLTRIDADMQTAMFGKLVRADLAQIARESPAAYASRFITDVTFVREAVGGLITSMLKDALMLVALFVSLMVMDWQLTLAAMVILPLAAWPVSAIGRTLKKLSRSTQAQAAGMTSQVHEGLAGIRLAKTYRLEDYLTERARGTFEKLRLLKVRAADQKARIDPTMEVLGGVAVAAVFYVVGLRIAAGENSVGDFLGFVSAFLLAGQPMRALGNLWGVVQQGLAALERVFAVLDQTPRIADRPGAIAIGRAQGEIRFDGVSFAYDDGAAALSDVSLTVPAGQRVALVGRSGAGKSTIFNLVPRLYEPTAGRVLLDGRDVRDITLASLREQIALVSQEAVIFDDTVRRNIGFGRPGASDEEIVAAAKAARAHDFIMASPDGYDTRAGDRGQRFSGGERQRITIARAILRDAPVLLLDEATSALDAESEALIREALDRLSQGRTTFVIAHRLSTIQDADIIVAMDRGRIVEQGRHDELLARGGLYADLHALQFRDV